MMQKKKTAKIVIRKYQGENSNRKDDKPKISDSLKTEQ